MVMLYPSMSLFAFMECPSMTQACSTIAIKSSWQIVYVLIILPRMLQLIHARYEIVLAMVSFLIMSSCWQYVCHAMPCVECIELANMPTYICFCHVQFSAKSESVNETYYVYMGAIISSVTFWLMISKGLLFYAFSRFMPCLYLL